MNKRLSFLMVIGALLFVTVVVLQTGNVGTTALWRWSNEGQWLLPLVPTPPFSTASTPVPSRF